MVEQVSAALVMLMLKSLLYDVQANTLAAMALATWSKRADLNESELVLMLTDATASLWFTRTG
jgi:hypothetical protein